MIGVERMKHYVIGRHRTKVQDNTNALDTPINHASAKPESPSSVKKEDEYLSSVCITSCNRNGNSLVRTGKDFSGSYGRIARFRSVSKDWLQRYNPDKVSFKEKHGLNTESEGEIAIVDEGRSPSDELHRFENETESTSLEVKSDKTGGESNGNIPVMSPVSKLNCTEKRNLLLHDEFPDRKTFPEHAENIFSGLGMEFDNQKCENEKEHSEQFYSSKHSLNKYMMNSEDHPCDGQLIFCNKVQNVNAKTSKSSKSDSKSSSLTQECYSETLTDLESENKFHTSNQEGFSTEVNDLKTLRRKMKKVKPKNISKKRKLDKANEDDIFKFEEENDVDQSASNDNVPEKEKPAKRRKTENKKKNENLVSENFVKLDLKKKIFLRGKKKTTGAAYKRQQWKSRNTNSSKNFGTKCFKCGEDGHWAKHCGKNFGSSSRLKREHHSEEMKYAPDFGSDLYHNTDCKETMDSEDFSLDDIPYMARCWPRMPYHPPPPPPAVIPLFKPIDGHPSKEALNEVKQALGALGYTSFRYGQHAVTSRIVSGLSTLVVSSTGSGKSLCYQLPAYLYYRKAKYLTLVISPLVALMEDQVGNLPVVLKGACLHTNMTKGQRDKVTKEVCAGKIAILLLSPEALVAGSFGTGCLPPLNDLPPIAFACIDEAHCVSEWSHNFRPMYLRVCKNGIRINFKPHTFPENNQRYKENQTKVITTHNPSEIDQNQLLLVRFLNMGSDNVIVPGMASLSFDIKLSSKADPKRALVLRERLGVKCMLGLTATATHATSLSIAKHLGITPNEITDAVISKTTLPSNLHVSVSRDEDRDKALVELLSGSKFSECTSIIVYCTRREQTERLAATLRACLQNLAPTEITEDKDVENEEMSEDRETKKRKKEVKKRQPKKNARNRRPKFVSWDAECYHAGMSAAHRRRVQKRFMSGDLRIVVATVAFGMGLDKSDVRAIIHYNMPKSFENFVQEIGRAGRDGKPAHCHVFLDEQGEDLCELRRHAVSSSADMNTVKQLVEMVFPSCDCKERTFLQSKSFSDDKIKMTGCFVSKSDPDTICESTESSDKVSSVNDAQQSSNKTAPTVDDTDMIDSLDDDEELSIDLCSVDMDTIEEASTCKGPSLRICKGHHVSLSTSSSVQKLDMPEETILTLLSYLELQPKTWTKVLNPVKSSCTIKCYGGVSQFKLVATKFMPVTAALNQLKRDQGNLTDFRNFTFDVVKVADDMGWDIDPVYRELRALHWNTEFSLEPDSFKRGKSGILIEFDNPSLHVVSPGDLTNDEIDIICEQLFRHIQMQEKTKLLQLDALYNVLRNISHNQYFEILTDIDEEADERLRHTLQEYFGCSVTELQSLLLKLCPSDVKVPVSAAKWGSISRDVRTLVVMNEDIKFTGRSIARIFHGIDSPCFPAEVWGRDRRFWRAHLDVDFNELRNFVTEEIIRHRR